MSIYNCATCRKDNRCAMQNDYARVSLFAFGRGTAVPDCLWYQPDYWNGVEGVLNLHRAEVRKNVAN